MAEICRSVAAFPPSFGAQASNCFGINLVARLRVVTRDLKILRAFRAFRRGCDFKALFDMLLIVTQGS
jgi:hypothetical protein